jgi:PhzF family phenazine biosynthesis protein
MPVKIYQVDTFTDHLFGGNPAAVCPLKNWLPDETLQRIASENNLSETAFYVRQGDHYTLRWFTPAVEVDLCGHATLAAAHVLFYHEGHTGEVITFHSPKSGLLSVRRQTPFLTLDFPADQLEEAVLTKEIKAGFDKEPLAVFRGKTDLLLIYEKEPDIQQLTPYFRQIAKLDCRGVIVTAPGNTLDFVSRFFTPQCGIDEDPVTGSAHTTLTPYWAGRLGKSELTALQLSKRRGYLECTQLGKRVTIRGQAILYMMGELHLG